MCREFSVFECNVSISLLSYGGNVLMFEWLNLLVDIHNPTASVFSSSASNAKLERYHHYNSVIHCKLRSGFTL